MNELIIERLSEYNIKSSDEELNAIKEITQEIILYALSKTKFFERANFCGGTALRIVHGLNRFSEDLDFSTRIVDPNFQFDDFMEDVLLTLKDYGLEMSVKKARDDSFVKARELKEDSEKWKISFPSNKKLKKVIIKLEIDINPPDGAIEKKANLDFPILHQIKINSLETLFAGKIHALLCRKYIKGRDWYDLLWFIKKKTNINYEYLRSALQQMGPYAEQMIQMVDRKFVVEELEKKIKSLNWIEVQTDVRRFLKSDEIDTLRLWDEDLFLDKIKKIV